MSDVAEEVTPASDTAASDLANGGIKEKKDLSKLEEGPMDWASLSSNTNTRGSFRGGRPPFRGSRGGGGFRGGFRGRRGGGMNMSTRHLDEKAMYLLFEKPINSATAKEVMAFGKDATSVGFGRGCTLHFKTPEEAKEIMAKIKELKFCGLDPNVEYAYKKRVLDSEKRTTGGDEEEEEEEEEEESTTTTTTASSPCKKPKVESSKETEEKDKEEVEEEEEEAKGEGGEEEAEEDAEGEEIGDEEGDEEVEDEEAEGEEVEGEEVEGEEAEAGDYAEEEGQEENEEEFEAGDPGEENEDDIDEDEYNS